MSDGRFFEAARTLSLLVHCSGADASRIESVLHARGLDCQLRVCGEKETFIQEIYRAGGAYDAVLCWLTDGRFTTSEIFNVGVGLAVHCPFVMIAPSADSVPLNLMETGAHNVVTEGNLDLLPLILVRAVSEYREQRSMRAALANSNASFEQIALHVDDVLWLLSADAAEVIYVSPAFEKVWGMPVETMYRDPRQWLECVHPDERQAIEKLFTERVLKGQGELVSRYRICRPDGGIRWIEDRIFPVRDERGRLLRLAGVARDVTEMIQLHDELKLAQRLEAVGQLAAGIAHEINTPAQFIGDNLGFLQDACKDLLALIEKYDDSLGGVLEPGEPVREGLRKQRETIDFEYLSAEVPLAIEQALDGVGRVTTIVRAMKEFSHPGGEQQEAVDINALIESTATVSRNEWKYIADMDLRLDAELPPVVCYPQPLSQVILNLIINAAHAIHEKTAGGEQGRIEVTTRRDGAQVEVAVRDSGCGIPEAVRGRIFDQFFTTKDVGKGTGQGLAIARTVIVDGHGGTLDFDTEIGVGTVFRLRIPIAGCPQSDQEADGAEAA